MFKHEINLLPDQLFFSLRSIHERRQPLLVASLKSSQTIHLLLLHTSVAIAAIYARWLGLEICG